MQSKLSNPRVVTNMSLTRLTPTYLPQVIMQRVVRSHACLIYHPGGLICRAILEKNSMKIFVSLSSSQAGQYGGKNNLFLSYSHFIVLSNMYTI